MYFFYMFIRLLYYPITLIIYNQKKHQLKKVNKNYLSNLIYVVKNKVSMYHWDNLAFINSDSYLKSIFKIHQQLIHKLKEENKEIYDLYKYEKNLSLLTLDSIGLSKFVKAFQLPDKDRLIYVTGKIDSYYKTHEDKGTLYIKDEFGDISVKIDHSNIQYLLDYFQNLHYSLDAKRETFALPENNLEKLNKKLDEDIKNLVVTVPLLIFAKNRQAKDFYNFEVGKNVNYYAAHDMPILLLSDTSKKYSDYSLFP